MNIHEELEKKSVLPKPEKPPTFKVDHSKQATNNKRKVKYYSKNENLYESIESDLSDLDKIPKLKSEAEVRSQILEVNGGNTYSDHVLVARWKKNVDNINAGAPKQPFKKNALMRNLYEQKMNKSIVANPMTSDSASGKDKDNLDVNKGDVEGPCWTQSTEDPDFYYLRDTTKRDKVNDDGYRFEFRGTKTTTTPLSYAINNLKKEDFAFTKK